MNIISFPLQGGLRANSPKRIIIHSMAENVIGEDGIIRHASRHLEHEGYSAHILACPNGDKYRCRHDKQGAAHAKGFNDNSLGLEALVPGTHDYASFLKAIKEQWVSKEQYQTILAQCREWYQLYPIERIDRHSDVDPQRKRDPGAGFPWEQLRKDLGLQ
jgi:N-acetyl-anhydromuramyl-L-alanine amidase AmpD